MTTPPMGIKNKLSEILTTREYIIPTGEGFEGTGAPGLYLERLLGLKTSNADVPDAGGWEVKFSSGDALITLFQKEPYPRERGRMIRSIINRWGWVGQNGQQSFRHTISGQSDLLEVVDDAGEIRVRRLGHDDVVPHWPHDVILTTFARKLGNLIHVQGTKKGRTVIYESAEFLSQAKVTELIKAIVTGTICIEFNAFIRENGSLRNHGTRFRIRNEDLHRLYANRQQVR